MTIIFSYFVVIGVVVIIVVVYHYYENTDMQEATRTGFQVKKS